MIAGRLASSANAHVFMESHYSDALTGDVVGEMLQGAAGSSVSGDNISIDDLEGRTGSMGEEGRRGQGSAKALK